MRKQAKLVAVLSTAVLLVIGAPMASFAATGRTEEDGTWVYYNRDDERATDQWKKSGNNWYYLDSDSEMAIDTLIEDGDNYYYVDVDGVMAANQRVAIKDEDAGEDDEPEHYWYYFQASGKALANGDSDKVSLKTINGKKYTSDEDGKVFFGWVDDDSAERVDDPDGDGFKEGVYYFGGEDDGTTTVGRIQLDITYDEATEDDYKYTAAAFNDDEGQSRWFYFKSNGKKVYAENGDRTKDKTINGRKYASDEYGTMVAEWSLDKDDPKKESNYSAGTTASGSAVQKGTSGAGGVGTRSYATGGMDGNGDGALTGSGKNPHYTQVWKYFNSVDDGARASKGWFKVVSAEYLNDDRYDDDEEARYYADGSGNLYIGEFKTIKGKKYAFRNDGRMINGLKFIYEDKDSQNLTTEADDDDYYPFDDEDNLFDNAADRYETNGFRCYYFGGGDDGSMRTGRTIVSVDDENHSFYLEKSGESKGVGVAGEKGDKLYQSSMLLGTDSDDKYIVVKKTTTIDSITNKKTVTHKKLNGVADFIDDAGPVDVIDDKTGDESVDIGHVPKKTKDLGEAYVLSTDAAEEGVEYILVNIPGKVTDSNSKNKDGNDYYYVAKKGGITEGVYVEDQFLILP